jgi:prepilin-type N-terminal cleavage/methylation domain-containing protein
MRDIKKKNRGFTLLEMMVSMSIGLIVIAGAVQLYSQAVKATFTTSQKAELQEDFRAAGNIMARDISLAGAGALGQQGLAAGAIGLPSATGTLSVYPCSSTLCTYVNGTAAAFPTIAGSPTAPFMYSIIPGPNLGITINAAQGPTDILSVAYTDANLALNCYNVTVATAGSTSTATFLLPTPLPATCILPSGVLVPQSLLDPVVGLQKGDLIMFGNLAVGSVSTVAAGGAPNTFVVTFATGDPGHINQPNPTGGSLKQLPGSAMAATRLLLITYYLDLSPMDGVTPRLMRLQSGRNPAPVAENVAYLKFTYDVYDSGGTVLANQASLPAADNPSMITKINIAHMTMRSQLNGTTGYQGLDLQTSISARNVTFGQEYPISGTAY